MSKFITETVTYVHHWTDSLFTIKTTRSDSLRFRSGEFAMIGLEVDGKPLVRAYSIASPAWAEELEFYSIKVQDGPLTSRLQHIKVGDELLVSKKPTGTLVLDDLVAGKNLYMLATGTGLAPFLSLVREPEVYERFEKVILVHGVRHVKTWRIGTFLKMNSPMMRFLASGCVKNSFIIQPLPVMSSKIKGVLLTY